MSNIFKTKEITYIDDCRKLNYAECIGLLSHGIMFNNFNIIDEYDFKSLFLDDFIHGNIKRYTMRCIPEKKETVIKIEGYYGCYEIYFIPKDTYIKINILIDCKRIACIGYSVEELEDILL